MIPDFDNDGNLPWGVHRATMDEVEARFGQGSSERSVEAKELRDFVEWARRAGVARLIVDGSFATDKKAPNDVDIVILPGPGYPQGEQPALASPNRWPFLHVIVAVDAEDLIQWIEKDFGLDRNMRQRGVVEIEL